MINIMDFHPHADGITCDFVAINDAVASAKKGDGILFPTGKQFLLTRDVVINKDLIISGYGATLLEGGGSLKIEGHVKPDVGIPVGKAIHRNDQRIKETPSLGFRSGQSILLDSNLSTDFLTIAELPGSATIVTEEYFANSIPMEYIHIKGDPNTILQSEIKVHLFSAVSVQIYGVTFKSISEENKNHLRIKYAKDCVFKDCIFTGIGASKTDSNKDIKKFTVNKSKNISFLNCKFLDMTYYGLRISRSSFITINQCHFENCYRRPLQARFCNYVVFSNNTAKKNAGFIFCVEACNSCTITNNQIHQVPRLYSEAQESAVSQTGIFIIGSENVVATGNQLSNCIGEGSIYVRTSNYLAVPPIDPKALSPFIKAIYGQYYLPTKNIIIDQNIIQDELTELAINHVAAIYMKSSGENIKITNNSIWTKKRGIVVRGKYENIDVLNNTIYTEGIGIRFYYKAKKTEDTFELVDEGTSGLLYGTKRGKRIRILRPKGFANKVRIDGNRITSSNPENDRILIPIQISENPILQILNNSIELSNQKNEKDSELPISTSDVRKFDYNAHLLSVRIEHNNDEHPIGSGQVIISQNILKSDGKFRRGLNVKIMESSSLIVENNLENVPNKSGT